MCDCAIVHDSCSVSAYRDGVRELACEILELMAEGLGVPDRWFLSRLIRDVDSDSVLRFNHYPATLNKNCKDKDMSPSHTNTNVGFGEHSDPQILTILRSNDVAGLQISLQDGVWNPVPPDPSAFCVNVGDLLQVYIYPSLFFFSFIQPHNLVSFSSAQHNTQGTLSLGWGAFAFASAAFALTPRTWDCHLHIIFQINPSM